MRGSREQKTAGVRCTKGCWSGTMPSDYAPIDREADAPASEPEQGGAAEPADAEQPSKGAEDVEAQERAGLLADEAAGSDGAVVAVERGSVPAKEKPVQKKTKRCRVKCCQSQEQIEQSLREAEARHAEAPEASAALPLEAKIDVLWDWAESTRTGCMGRCGERLVKYAEIQGMAEASEMDVDEMCGLLGAEVCGPRAVLGGRAGTVMQREERDGVERIQVRWEDDGTESSGPKHVFDAASMSLSHSWPDDAIKVSDLDEPLGEGSAVRHNGRRGTAATEGGSRIRWDDGTLSYIEVSELEVEVTVEREDFAAACTEQPEHTARMHAHLAAQLADAELQAATKSVKLAKRTCRLRCKLCCFELCEIKVRGYRMPDFLQMLGGVAAPTADAWLDWGVTIAFYLSGDVHWFEAALAINLLSGLLSGGLLGWLLRYPEKSPTAKRFPGDLPGAKQKFKAERQLRVAKARWQNTLPPVLVLGLPGLAPTAWTSMLLRADGDALRTITDFAGGAKVLKLFKVAELIVEMMPQSILQTYVGVAYGKFDPSSPTFSFLLPVSVTVSLLGAGSTVFGLEAEVRNAAAKKEMVSLGSRYGVVGLLLRTAQVTALIFWISLLGCAEKGWAAVAVVLGVLVFGGMCAEAVYRGRRMKAMEWKDKKWPEEIKAFLDGRGLSEYHDLFLSPKAGNCIRLSQVRLSMNTKKKIRVASRQLPAFKGMTDEQCEQVAETVAKDRDLELQPEGKWLEPFLSKLVRLWQPPKSVRASLLWLALHLALLGAMAAIFFDVQHVPNNYANKTLPMGGPGDPQHYDCHDRTSGLYPAYLASALCVLLAPLYAALDPEHGVAWLRGKPADERLKETNAAAEARLRAAAVAEQVDVSFVEQVDALWGWVEGIMSDGNPDADGQRTVKRGAIAEVATAAEMEPEALCELLGARWDPVRGPRAVLGGRAGIVISIMIVVERSLGAEKIIVRWKDDGTNSPSLYKNRLPNADAIKVSDLDEPLGKGSAVRHDGRRGTAATEPDGDGNIMIRWEDDGTLSQGHIQVSELEVEVAVGREDFAAACAEQPERTAKLHVAAMPELKEQADATVLDAKIAAVWRWADAVEDGNLGATELQRLADRVVPDGSQSNTAEVKYKKACEALGLDAEDPEVSIGREAFAAACHFKDSWGRSKVPVDTWFEALRLELEEPGPGCLASATASWPLRILCMVLAAVLLAHFLLGDDDGSSSGSYSYDPLGGEVEFRALCAVGALLLLIVLWDVKRIHRHRQAAHKESAERQVDVKEAVAVGGRETEA
eukprot:COSAG04_NODE_175_length_21521_cov_167.404071_9_plen_1287_part_00